MMARRSLFLEFLPFNAWRTPRRTCVGTLATGSRRFLSSAKVLEFEGGELPDDARATEKDTALRLALSRLSGDFGKESMLSLQRFFGSRCLPVISTGSLKLDVALGIGGLPKGRIVEIFGQEASGKTTLAFHIIKEAQKLGGYCAFLDVENAMDPSLLESIGVNPENLLISQPDSAENVLCMVDTLTKSRSVDVIVVDSVAALVPQRELDVPMLNTGKDLQSQIMTQALRKIHYSLCNSQTLIIFINQVRSNLGSMKGSGHADLVTCGGNGLRFYSAIRMRIRKTGLLKTEDKVTGVGISVQVVKNKLAPPMGKAELDIQFGRGICYESEVLDLACEHGIILKEGRHFFIEDQVLTSKQEAECYLAENGRVLDQMVTSLRRKLFQGEP